MRSPSLTARARRRAATRHASSSGAPSAFSEGERKPEAPWGETPRFASTRAHSGSTPAFCASSETRSASGSTNRHRAKQVLPDPGTAKEYASLLYSGALLVIGPIASALNQRAQGSQRPLDDLGGERALLPLFEREFAGVGLVQLEHPLHLGGEAAAVDLEVYLVVAQQAVAVNVRRAHRGPDAVYGSGLGVDHDVPVAEDPHARLQKLVEVTPAEPVGGNVVRVLRYEDLDVHAPPGRLDEAGPHRPVGDEVGVGEVDLLVGPVYGLQIHGPDREDPHVRVVAVEHGGRVPRAPPAVLQLREFRGAVGVPEVHEVVLHLAGPEAPDPDVRVAPARRVERADVVAAQESYPSVHGHQVAVVPEDVARVRQVGRPPERPEVERVDLLREPLERRGNDHVRQPVEDHAHLDPLAGLARQSLNEAAAHLITLPDKRPDEDLAFGAFDLLQHRLVEPDAVGIELQPAVAGLDLDLGLVHPREPLARFVTALADLGQRNQDADERDLHRRERHEDPDAQLPRARERPPNGGEHATIILEALPAAETGDEGLGLLDGAPPYLGELLVAHPLLATLEVEHGGPAHRDSARVADGRRGCPASDRNQLDDLPRERPQPEARGQHPEELPRPVHRELLPVGGGDVQDHPGLVRGHYRHVRARDGQGPDHGVLPGVLADDLLADRPSERRIALRERDQVVFVECPHDAGHQLLEQSFLSPGGQCGLTRLLDSLPGERELVPRDGEDDLCPLDHSLRAEKSGDLIRPGRVPGDGQGRLFPGSLAGFVEYPVYVSEAHQAFAFLPPSATQTDVKLILDLFQIYYVQATGWFQPGGELLAAPA